MRCSRCGHENKDGAKFCNECGMKLDIVCASCSTLNPPGSKFCSECGTALASPSSISKTPDPGLRTLDSRLQPPSSYTPKHLAERILAEQAAMEVRGTGDGERKTITALFADLAGFTALARDLDPEDTRRIIDPALQLMMDAVHRYEEAEFIYEQPPFPEPEYTFKHALTQEVAYNSLLIERRKSLHERIAQAIESLFHSRLDDHYSDLAQHYTRSGNTRKAVDYLHLAAQQAVQRSANREAVHHLTTALESLKTLPDTLERAQRELTLQIALGPLVMVTKGYGAPEVEGIYTRAQELCRQIGEISQLFTILRGIWEFYLVRAQYKTARELGEQCLTLAQSGQNPPVFVEAHFALGLTLLALGEFVSARAHSEQAIALYDPQHHRSHIALYGQDPGVSSLSDVALVLWPLGYPDQASQRIGEALALAQELAHPYSLAIALDLAAWLQSDRRDEQAVQKWAAALITLATEQGFPYWTAAGTMLHGWLLTEQGQGKEGIAHIHQGLAASRATGAEFLRSYWLRLLIESYRKAGQVEEALTTLAEALAHVSETGERIYEAELYRLKGELTLCAPDPLDYAEAHPRPEQIFLIIEVADASLRQDRQRKARLYARSGIPQYWVIDLARRRVEVMTSPNKAAERYARVRIFRAGQTIPLPQGQRITVSDILPPRRA